MVVAPSLKSFRSQPCSMRENAARNYSRKEIFQLLATVRIARNTLPNDIEFLGSAWVLVVVLSKRISNVSLRGLKQALRVVKAWQRAVYVSREAFDPARDGFCFVPSTFHTLAPVPDVACGRPQSERVGQVRRVVGRIAIKVQSTPKASSHFTGDASRCRVVIPETKTIEVGDATIRT